MNVYLVTVIIKHYSHNYEEFFTLRSSRIMAAWGRLTSSSQCDEGLCQGYCVRVRWLEAASREQSSEAAGHEVGLVLSDHKQVWTREARGGVQTSVESSTRENAFQRGRCYFAEWEEMRKESCIVALVGQFRAGLPGVYPENVHQLRPRDSPHMDPDLFFLWGSPAPCRRGGTGEEYQKSGKG